MNGQLTDGEAWAGTLLFDTAGRVACSCCCAAVGDGDCFFSSSFLCVFDDGSYCWVAFARGFSEAVSSLWRPREGNSLDWVLPGAGYGSLLAAV